MIGRPCRPDEDVKWLWQTLLPNTPLPACGMADDQSADFDHRKADHDAHAREQAGQSWLRKFWPVR
jgi:hypothetical protein